MRWLITRSLLVLLTVTLVTGAAMLLGRALPIPDRVALLHLGDCQLPCWIGITPGKTSIGEARQRIKDVYVQMAGYTVDESGEPTCCLRILENGKSRLLITLNTWGNPPQNSPVQLIYLGVTGQSGPKSDTLTIADTAAYLGNPTYFVFSAAVGGQSPPMLVYTTTQCELVPLSDVNAAQDEINFSLPVNSLTIYDQLPVGQDVFYSPKAWRGFGQFYQMAVHNR